MRAPLAWICVTLSLITSGAAAAGEVRVRLSGVDCPEAARLAARIEEQVALETEGLDPITIAVEPSDGGLRIRMTGVAGVEWTQPFSRSDCPELPLALRLGVRGWRQGEWDAARAGFSGAAMPRFDDAPAVADDAPEVSDEAPAVAAPAPTPEAPVAPTNVPGRFALSLLGGLVSSTSGDAWTSAMGFDALVPLSHGVGLSLAGRYNGPVPSRPTSPSIGMAGLGVTFLFPLGDRDRATLSTGPAFERLFADETTVDRLAWMAAARWHLMLVRGVELTVGVDAARAFKGGVTISGASLLTGQIAVLTGLTLSR